MKVCANIVREPCRFPSPYCKGSFCSQAARILGRALYSKNAKKSRNSTNFTKFHFRIANRGSFAFPPTIAAIHPLKPLVSRVLQSVPRNEESFASQHSFGFISPTPSRRQSTNLISPLISRAIVKFPGLLQKTPRAEIWNNFPVRFARPNSRRTPGRHRTIFSPGPTLVGIIPRP